MRNLMLVVLFAGGTLSLALAVLKFLHKQWFGTLFLAVIGVSVIAMTAWSVWSASQLGSPLADADSAGAIVMRVSSDSVGETLYWAVGFLFTAIFLAQYPDTLWTKWLSYLVSLGALVLFGVMILISWGQRLERVLANANGMEVRSEVRGEVVPDSDTKVAWTQVGTVKRVEVYVNRARSVGGGTAVLRHEFVLLDRAGKELLNIEDALEPPDRYQRFLEAIPRWTGLQVQNVRRRE